MENAQMNDLTINTVIFDLGGVLIDWNPRHLYRKIFTDEAEMEYFLTHICTMEWNEYQDRGRSWAEGVALLSEQYPEYTEQIKVYHERWSEMLNGAIDDSVEILKTLKAQGIRVVALTNWSTETFPIAEAQFPFLQWFEGIVVSGKEKMKKPEPEIFQLLFDRYQVNPKQAIFIDDSPTNVQGANQVGLHSIRFTDAAALRTALKAFGLVV